MNAIIIQLMLTYTIKLKSESILCMRHGHGICVASIGLTWVSCLLSENVVARGLSILRILSKRPPIGVMQQEHANAMTRSIISVYFPTTLS